jgi:hypothetical protein
MSEKHDRIIGAGMIGVTAGYLIAGSPGAFLFGLLGVGASAAKEDPQGFAEFVERLNKKQDAPVVCSDLITGLQWTTDPNATPEQKAAAVKFFEERQPHTLAGVPVHRRNSSRHRPRQNRRRNAAPKQLQPAQLPEPKQLNAAPQIEEVPHAGRLTGARNEKTKTRLRTYIKLRLEGKSDTAARILTVQRLHRTAFRIKQARRSLGRAIRNHLERLEDLEYLRDFLKKI